MKTRVHKKHKVTINKHIFNPLKAELNHICHLLILLGDLTFYMYVHLKYIPI
jgi:hypothetical protein